MKSVFPAKDKLLAEFRRATQWMSDVIPKVYSHNDAQIKNMIYHPKTSMLFKIIIITLSFTNIKDSSVIFFLKRASGDLSMTKILGLVHPRWFYTRGH